MCPARNLADSATPAFAAIRTSLARSTGPAMPTNRGSVTRRARTREIHFRSVAGLKQRLLTR